MSASTGQSLERIERDVERDFIMTAAQSKEYGIIDDIIDRPGRKSVNGYFVEEPGHLPGLSFWRM